MEGRIAPLAIPTPAEVSAAVEAITGGKVSEIKRQNRWRPTWFVDVKRDGAVLPLVVRGDRFDASSLPLSHEYSFHRLLLDRGIRVAPLHGFHRIGDLDVILMDRVPGKPDFDDVEAEGRDTVVDEYLQQLAAIHSLDPAPFLDAGIRAPPPGDNPAVIEHRQRAARFRAAKTGPEPFAEFCLGWLARHEPTGVRPAVPCLLDTGQFHHANGHLVAILDLEFGQLGDPMVDLAVWRMRDTLIPYGDMRRLYARYEALRGEPVDLDAIKWRHFAAAAANALMFGPAVAAPQPETDLMTYMQWNSETNLMATDFLGEELGIELPAVEPPPVAPSRDNVTFAHMARQLQAAAIGDEAAAHQVRLCFRMARHLHRRSEIGAELDRQDIDDAHELLGRRPADWRDAAVQLEAFVLADAAVGRHDADLTRLFHKRNLRAHMALGPAGSSMTRHYQCQRFDGQPARVVQL